MLIVLGVEFLFGKSILADAGISAGDERGGDAVDVDVGDRRRAQGDVVIDDISPRLTSNHEFARGESLNSL